MEKEKIIRQKKLKTGDLWSVSISGNKCIVEIDATDYLPPHVNNVSCLPPMSKDTYLYNPVTGEGRDPNDKPIQFKFYKVLYRVEF